MPLPPIECDVPGCANEARFRLQRMFHPVAPGVDPDADVGNAPHLIDGNKVSFNEYCVPCLQRIVANIPPTTQDQGALAPADAVAAANAAVSVPPSPATSVVPGA